MQLCREQRGTVTTPLSRNPPALFEKRVTSETHSSIAQTACCTAARECSSARRLSRDVRVIRYNFEKSFSTLRKCHEPRSSCMSIVPSTESVERHLRVMKRRTRSEHIWSAAPPPNHAVWKAATAALMSGAAVDRRASRRSNGAGFACRATNHEKRQSRAVCRSCGGRGFAMGRVTLSPRAGNRHDRGQPGWLDNNKPARWRRGLRWRR